jgi:peptide/nickel transport system substrate-binding protein
MNFRKSVPLFLIIVLAVFLTVPCAASGRNDSRSVAKDTLVVAQTSDATTLDPQKQGRMPDMNILINIFDTLVTRDKNGSLSPSLATEWRATDSITWRFTLRRGVKFHNGEDFNAQAVKFSLDRLMNPQTASPIAELRNLVACNIVDEYTVDLVTDAPDPIIPNKLVMFGGVILPPKYVSENSDDTVSKNPVGTGPFKFVSWRKDAEVVMEANASYWRGAPAFNRLVFRVIPNWADVSAALRVGEVDVVIGLPADLAPEIRASSNLKLLSADWIRTFYVNIDTSVPPLNLKPVRQAMNYAVDIGTIIQSVLGGNARQVATLLPQENYGIDKSITPYPYDPALARRLLAEAGYPNGFTVDFDAINTDITYIQAITGYLEAVGIKVNINMIDATSLTAKMTAKTAAPLYYIGQTGWTMDGLSNFQSYAHRERRYARSGNEELDSLVIIEETTIDPAARQRAFTRAQEILKEEAFYIYLWQQNNLTAVSTAVNYTPNVIGLLWMYDAQPAK